MENAIRNNSAVVNGASSTGMLESLRQRYSRYRLYRSTLRELSRLSDRGLADLGLSRSMIRSLAREAAYNK